MKKKVILISTICAFFFASCESGFEADGRKMAKLICKEQQLSAKADRGDEEAKTELQKVQDEREKLKEELSKKYAKDIDNEDMRKKAQEITEEEMAKCK